MDDEPDHVAFGRGMLNGGWMGAILWAVLVALFLLLVRG